MNDLVSVDVNELKTVASSIASRRDELMNVNYSIIRPVMQSSKECIDVSGVNFDEIDELFNSIFFNASNRISDLSNVLTNKIIPNYENINKSK